MRQLAVLLSQSISYDEPVLLVGETGCGKTTICQMFAQLLRRELFTVNCHLNSEAADFIGRLRPSLVKRNEVIFSL